MGTIVDGGLQAFGAILQGHSAAESDKYNSQLNSVNSNIAKQNAAIAGQAGAEQATLSSERSRATLGSVKANQAASGIDVNSGSASDTQASVSEIGELDALTVRSNATKEAYGYKAQSENFEAQSNLDKYQEGADLTGSYINAAGTFLGTLDNAASNFAKYQSAGGFGG